MVDTLDEMRWEILLNRIKKGDCTPFLGAGACFGTLPLGKDLAHELAEKYDYPFDGNNDLARVAQFIAVKSGDSMYPKEKIQEKLKGISPPDFNNPDEPHGLLAKLPLSIYITTNYDNFMYKALESKRKCPKTVLCCWNERIKIKLLNQSSLLSEISSEPNPKNPVVYHMHGHIDLVESIVLTEDDYLDFLISLSKSPKLLPKRLKEAFTSTSLLFLGYRLADWDFRVIFRNLVTYLERSCERSHISVQLLPDGEEVTEKEKIQAKRYFDQYFNKQDIYVYWGTCLEFSADLRKRCEDIKIV